MAFDYFAVAIRWHEGKYSAIAETGNVEKLIDWPALIAAYPLNDLTEERDGMRSGYVDQGTILPVHRFREFAQSDSIKSWLDGPAKGAAFILIHRAEWESGLTD